MKKKLQALAARVKVELPALFLALKDHRTSWPAKLLAFLTVAYALSPVDLIPDFIPVIGYLDDLLILPLLAALTIKLMGERETQKMVLCLANYHILAPNPLLDRENGLSRDAITD